MDILIQTISTNLPESKRLELLQDTGRSLAQANGLQASGDTTADIQKAVDVVNTLGATAELTSKGKTNYVKCHNCPVATMVHREPHTCQMVAAFFSEACGKKVNVQCKKNGTVVCGFKFS